MYRKFGNYIKVGIFMYKKFGMDKNNGLYKWFSTHPFFSINGMCKLIKVDTSNFTRYLASGKIPEKYIPKIEAVIKNYGYVNNFSKPKI